MEFSDTTCFSFFTGIYIFFCSSYTVEKRSFTLKKKKKTPHYNADEPLNRRESYNLIYEQ